MIKVIKLQTVFVSLMSGGDGLYVADTWTALTRQKATTAGDTTQRLAAENVLLPCKAPQDPAESTVQIILVASS